MRIGPKARKPIKGFSLLEATVAVAVLTILMIGVFRQIQRAQIHYRVENQKLDMTQQEREFIDQFARDLHQAGYPSPASLNLTDLTNATVSAGITSISPTSLTMQGDLDGTGNGVQIVTYTFSNAAGCPGGTPCILRTVTPKAGGVPAAYVEVQNLIANGAQFTAYDAGGNQIGLPLGPPPTNTTADAVYKQLRAIKGVQVSFTLQGTARDGSGAAAPQVSMTGMARVPNN
jgi:type II secretory pathway pseudopilin PulG